MTNPTRAASPTCACPKCGKVSNAAVEAMPLTSLKYRLMTLPMCYGHPATPTADAEGESGG